MARATAQTLPGVHEFAGSWCRWQPRGPRGEHAPYQGVELVVFSFTVVPSVLIVVFSFVVFVLVFSSPQPEKRNNPVQSSNIRAASFFMDFLTFSKVLECPRASTKQAEPRVTVKTPRSADLFPSS